MTRVKIRPTIVLATIALGALLVWLGGAGDRIAAICWQARLAAAPDDDVDLVIREIGQSGRSGIAVLVAALNAQRECVAHAAKEELLAALARRTTLVHGERDARLMLAMQSLADAVEHFHPAARKAAMDLAGRIMREPFRGDTGKLLAAGEKVFRAGTGTKLNPEQMRSDDALIALKSEQDSFAARLDSLLKTPAESLRQTAADRLIRSDGALPALLPVRNQPPQTADGQANQPRLLDSELAVCSPLPREQGRQTQSTADRSPAAPAFAVPARSDMAARADDHVRPLVYYESQSADVHPAAALGALAAVDLMRDLNSDEQPRVSAAEAELKRRGFTAVHLEAARRMFDPDPAVRKRLAGQLPDLPGVDTVAWLMQLSRDADAEVRLAAISFLATSSDPAVLNEVGQIAARDSDENIRRIAERIAGQHNLRR